jgi:hypothetical protein
VFQCDEELKDCTTPQELPPTMAKAVKEFKEEPIEKQL